MLRVFCFLNFTLLAFVPVAQSGTSSEPIPYNNPGLVVDLGVGLWAWPLPMDYDRDGDLDLVVSCPDKPYRGTYFFENPGKGNENGSPTVYPIFQPGVRIAEGFTNVQISYIDGEPIVLTPGKIHPDFRGRQFAKPIKLPIPVKVDSRYKRIRANQWKLLDWEGDGDLDVIVGIGIWDDYGWDDAWDEKGHWTNGPLHGFVYLIENRAGNTPSSTAKNSLSDRLQDLATADFAKPRQLTTTDGNPIDVYGMPSPNFADFDGDGDRDLICGEFLDGFTWFENVGNEREPRFQPGRQLVQSHPGQSKPVPTQPVSLRMDLQMITPVAIDWDADGDLDLICGDEDGRVAFIELQQQSPHAMPLFAAPRYFSQQAKDVKFGALVTPFSIDWDQDGDDDLICGNTAGYIGWIENLGGGASPRWAAPRRLQELLSESEEEQLDILRYKAGPQGSIQGPCEAKWGYTAPVAADWNHDGRPDVITNGIWGKVTWHERTEQGALRLAQPIIAAYDTRKTKPDWNWWSPQGGELATQWRTTPYAIDWNGDGLTDLIMLDHEGYLAFFERKRSGKELALLPPRRIFKGIGHCEFDSRHRPVGNKRDDLLRLNAMRAGASGRRKFCLADWDGDGRLDLLVNSFNVHWLRNVRTDEEGFTWFEDKGPLDERVLAGHTTAPTTVDWDKNGIPDLLVGAEDGRLYYKQNPRRKPTEIERKQLAQRRKTTLRKTVGTSTQTSRGQEDSAMLLSEFIYDSKNAPTPRCHATTIAETPAGLVAAWFGGKHENNPDVGIWVSRHIKGTWTDPVEVLNGIQHSKLRYPCWNPVLFQQPAGPLHLFAKVGPSPSKWWGTHQTSLDHGQTWTRAVRLPVEIDGPVKNKPVLLPDGTLLCGSSTEYDGWRVHFEKTRDWGQTWDRIGPINDGKVFNAIQPTILIKKTPGKTSDPSQPTLTLQILCRSREGSIVTSHSTDQGETWSPLERTTLPNPNSGIDAVTLKDGTHLLVYNHTRRGRSPLNVAWSKDGLHWQAILVLESEPGEYSYPAIIQTSDGLVHITYTWKRIRVKHVVLDPKQFQPRPIVNGQWPS